MVLNDSVIDEAAQGGASNSMSQHSAAKGGAAGRIPRIFHFTVPTPIRPQQAELIDAVRRMHPDWDVKIWLDDTPIENARLEKYRDRPRSGAGRADLIRLDAVYAYGGVYLDADMRVLRPLDQLIEHYDFFMGCESAGNLTNALIGAATRHPAIDSIIRFLEENEPDWSLPPNEATGPMLFARLLSWRTDVNILPRETFYPRNWWNETERQIHRLSYTDHLWDNSWGNKAEATAYQRRSVAVEAKDIVKKALAPVLGAVLRGVRRGRTAAERALGGAAYLDVHSSGTYACSAELVARTVHGHKLVLDGSDLSITPDIALRGYLEWPEEAFVRRKVRGGDWFVDVGANVGVFAMLAASLCGPLGRVLAFEPNPHARRLLTKSAVMNWYHDRVKIFETALGEAPDIAKLTYYPNRLGDAQIDSGKKNAQPFQATGRFLEQVEVEVPVCRLDDLIPVDLPIKILKVDAEGHEPKVLKGARRLLAARAFDYILLEVSVELFAGTWKDTLGSLRELVDLGYSAGSLDRDGLLQLHGSVDAALRGRGRSKTLVFAAAAD